MLSISDLIENFGFCLSPNHSLSRADDCEILIRPTGQEWDLCIMFSDHAAISCRVQPGSLDGMTERQLIDKVNESETDDEPEDDPAG